MELACTKKLLEYIGVKAEKVSEEIDPLFGWTANLIVVNRRKMLVVVHGASRCAFVLYGVTAKLMPKLPELILEGIRTLLRSEYVRPEIIEKYLDDLGREISFRANSSRKAVAGCNKVCERVKMYPELFEAGDLYQRKVLPWLNEDFLPGRGYMKAHEAIIAQLQERYGEPVQTCRALELEVSLELHTPCKRRIIVPDDLSFFQFHYVLQRCFEWKNCHLHQFVTEVDKAGYAAQIIHPEWDEMDAYHRALPYHRGLPGAVSALCHGSRRCAHGGLRRAGWLPSGDGSPERQKASGVSGNAGMGTFDLVAAAGCEADQWLVTEYS